MGDLYPKFKSSIKNIALPTQRNWHDI